MAKRPLEADIALVDATPAVTASAASYAFAFLDLNDDVLAHAVPAHLDLASLLALRCSCARLARILVDSLRRKAAEHPCEAPQLVALRAAFKFGDSGVPLAAFVVNNFALAPDSERRVPQSAFVMDAAIAFAIRYLSSALLARAISFRDGFLRLDLPQFMGVIGASRTRDWVKKLIKARRHELVALAGCAWALDQYKARNAWFAGHPTAEWVALERVPLPGEVPMTAWLDRVVKLGRIDAIEMILEEGNRDAICRAVSCNMNADSEVRAAFAKMSKKRAHALLNGLRRVLDWPSRQIDPFVCDGGAASAFFAHPVAWEYFDLLVREGRARLDASVDCTKMLVDILEMNLPFQRNAYGAAIKNAAGVVMRALRELTALLESGTLLEKHQKKVADALVAALRSAPSKALGREILNTVPVSLGHIALLWAYRLEMEKKPQCSAVISGLCKEYVAALECPFIVMLTLKDRECVALTPTTMADCFAIFATQKFKSVNFTPMRTRDFKLFTNV